MPHKKLIPFRDKNVEGVFHEYPRSVQEKLMKLRSLIFDIASEYPKIGKLEETLSAGSRTHRRPMEL